MSRDPDEELRNSDKSRNSSRFRENPSRDSLGLQASSAISTTSTTSATITLSATSAILARDKAVFPRDEREGTRDLASGRPIFRQYSANIGILSLEDMEDYLLAEKFRSVSIARRKEFRSRREIGTEMPTLK